MPDADAVVADLDPRFLADWSGLQGGRPREVLRPTSTAEVSVTVRRLPLCQAEAREMVSGLKSSAVFSGYRGSAPLDIPALEAAILALSRFGGEFAEALESVDLNPLVVRKAGEGIIALDAVVQWRR